MFTPCLNAACCARAGWCKRISYKQFTPQDRQNAQYFDCSPENGWAYYVKNKAREIYEREHPDDILQNEEPDRPEHENNNREPRVREDDVPDSGPGEENQGRTATDPDRVLELFQRGSGRSSTEGGTGVDLNRILRQLGYSEPSILRDAYLEFRRQVTQFPDDAFLGIPTTEPGPGELDF